MLDKSMQIAFSAVYSMIAYRLTKSLIPRFKDSFMKAHLVGVDQCKAIKVAIPESMGVIAGCIFLVTMFLYIPIPFLDSWQFGRHMLSLPKGDFDDQEFAAMLVALLTICCMLFLGFADDVLDLRWRHKLVLPLVAFVPLLMVYVVQYNVTTVVVPKPFRSYVGITVDLGLFYYLYMAMLAIFCTNAINILAGVNGLETGQSVVIGFSILVFNCMELWGDCWRAHLFSATFMMPFLGVSMGLLSFNWYPSKVFVGDTYCYFAGMTFAVVGIVGHFSKTMLLFFLPQILNFLFSLPQLFHFLPCPRHRMPKYNVEQDVLYPSTFVYDSSQCGFIGRISVWLFLRLGICQKWDTIMKDGSSTAGDSVSTKPNGEVTISNCTLVNSMLVWFKPMRENNLTTCILVFQVICSLFAFFIRYGVSKFVY